MKRMAMDNMMMQMYMFICMIGCALFFVIFLLYVFFCVVGV